MKIPGQVVSLCFVATLALGLAACDPQSDPVDHGRDSPPDEVGESMQEPTGQAGDVTQGSGVIGGEDDDPSDRASDRGNPDDRSDAGAGNPADQRDLGDHAEAAGDAIDDAALATRVRSVILTDTELSIMEIDVSTEDGVVTLSGEVESQEDADKAEQVASSVDGVQRVDNQLQAGAVN